MSWLPRIAPNSLSTGLPEEIFGFEILVRLPTKDLVRCRAVCRAWRRLASTRDFLLAHHLHQPSLPLVHVLKQTWGDIRTFDHRPAAAQARLQPVVRIDESTAIRVQASCDGLLLFSVCTFLPFIHRDFICNPTTRQIGQVPEIQDFHVTGLYRHHPTGEYRLLLHMRCMHREKEPCYVFALGSNQPWPRCIARPPEQAGFFDAPVLVSGNLHWSWWPDPTVKMDQSENSITVFDTTTESFRLMRGPVVQTSTAYLFEVDGTLGIYSCNDSVMAVDIWVMQDYETEVWCHKYHVKLLVAEIREHEVRDVIVVLHEERDVCVLYNFGKTVFLVDTEGKLLASSQLDAFTVFRPTRRIKESLVQHSFFSALQGTLNAWSFI